MEQGLYLAHCCIYRIAGKLREFHGLPPSWPSTSFCARNEKACGRQPEKVIHDQKNVWAAIYKSFICKKFYFNQFGKFSPVKVPKYWITEVIVCDHAHPLCPWTTCNANSSENPEMFVPWPKGDHGHSRYVCGKHWAVKLANIHRKWQLTECVCIGVSFAGSVADTVVVGTQ